MKKAHHDRWMGFVIMLIATLFVAVFLARPYSRSTSSALLLPSFGALILSFFLIWREAKSADETRQRFGKNNDLQWIELLNMDTLRGRFFENKKQERVRRILTGTYNEFSIRIFDYEFGKGNDSKRVMQYYTVIEAAVQGVIFPHIYLKPRQSLRRVPRDFFGRDKDMKISLPDAFDKKFRLFATQGYETEALQIFTPDILSELQQTRKKVTIEFAGENIYFYSRRLKKQEDLEKLYDLVKVLLDTKGALLKRLADDFEALHVAYKK